MELGDSIEALRRDPTSPEAARQVREGARARGALVQYAEAFTERGRRLADQGHPVEAIASYIEAALVYEEELDELAEAARLYQAVLDLDPAHRRALFALGLLLHDLSRFDDLVALYRRRLEQSKEDNERTTLYLYLAEILSEKLGQDETAFEEVMRAARLAPQNIRIISRLEKLGERAGRVEEVAVAIGDLILNQEDTKVRAALSLHLAELYMGPLDDHQRALAHYKAALSDDGGNPEILSAVEDVFRERERFDQLAELMEEAAGDRRIGPQRVRLERELARIYELELGDKKRALHALTRAARLFPEDRDLLDEVMRLGLGMGALDVVAATFADVAEGTSNGLLRTYLLLKLGHIYGNVLERPADAIKAYEAILAEDPSHKEARRRLGNLCERTGDFARLAELAEEEVRLSEGPARIEPLRRLARVKAKSLNDEAGARDAYRRILSLAPDDAEARAITQPGPPAMPEVPPSRFERPALVEPPTDIGADPVRANAPPPLDLAADLSDDLSDGRDSREATMLADDDDAAMLADDALEADPVGSGDVATIGDDAVLDEGAEPSDAAIDADALAQEVTWMVTSSQAVAAEPLPPEELEGDVRLRAPDEASAIEPSNEAPIESSTTPELDDLLHRLGEATRDGDRARELSLLEEVVEAHLALGQTERAFFAEVRIVRAAPAEMATRRMIELGRRAGSFGALLSTADEVVPLLDLDAQIRLELALAEVEANDMEAPERAEARLAALHRRAPDHPDVLDAWIALLEKSGAYEALSRALESEARRGQDPALWLRAAEVRSAKLADHDGAASLMLAALDRMPDEAALREAALGYLGRASRWREVITLHESRLYRVGGPERAVIRREIARVAQRELGDPTTAEKMLRLALAEQPRDEAALEALLGLYEAAGRWESVTEVLAGQIALAPAGAPRAGLRRRLAGVAELRLNRRDLALQHLDGAVREDPGDIEALTSIERLRREAGDWHLVADARIKLSRAHPDPALRAVHAIEAARLKRTKLGDKPAAVALYREALVAVPDHVEGLESLAELFEELGDSEGAVSTLTRLAAAVEGVDRAAVELRIGRLLEHALGEDEEAGRAYGRAVEVAPTHPDALSELARWREVHQDFEGAAALIERQAELADDDRRRAALWSRLAEIARVRLGDADRAIRASEQVLLADPDDLSVEATLGELYAARGGEEDVDRAYTHLARAARGLRRADAVRATHLYLAAGAAAVTLGLTEQAVAAYDAARELDPKRADALWPLVRLLADLGQWDRVHEVAAAIVLHHEANSAPAERAEAYALMARAERARGDREAAIRLAEKSLSAKVERTDALGLLAELHEEGGARIEAAEALRRLAARVDDPTERRAHRVKSAWLLGDGEHDLGKAIATLGELHAESSGDVEVARLLAQYRQAAGEPRGAVTALSSTAGALEGTARAELLVEAAAVASGPAQDRALARKLLEEALESAPEHAEAIGELARLCEHDRDFARLAELELRRGRFAEAAEVYRFRLDRPEDALAALERLDRRDETMARTLEAVAARQPGGGHDRRALDVWAEILDATPGHQDGLRRAAELAVKLDRRWQARLYLEVLAVLDEAGEPDRARLSELADAAPPRPKKPIDVPVSPRERASVLDPLLTQIGYAPLVALADDVPEPRPKKKDRVAPASLPGALSAAIAEASALFGLPVPPVFVRDDSKEPLAPAFFDEKPALVASLALAGKLAPPALSFHAGRALSLTRARALPLALLPLEILREGLEGLVRDRVAPELLFGDPKTSKRRGKALDRALSPAARLAVTSAVSEWLVKPNRATLFDEREAVHRTAERAGLIACGSPVVAAECLTALHGSDRRWRLPLVALAASRELPRLFES